MSGSPMFGGDMFKNMLNDLMRLVPSGGPVQWQLAYQLAGQIAAGETGTEANPDPLERIRFEELSAIAELHVTEVAGMSIVPGGGHVRLVPVTRGEWARRILDTWQPVLDRLAAVIAPPVGGMGAFGGVGGGVGGLGEGGGGGGDVGHPSGATPFGDDLNPFPEEDDADAMTAMLGKWMSAMFPAMTAMQVGSVAGHLSERSLGQYDVPLAPVASDELYVIASNIQATADDWSLPIDDLRLWLCLHEMTCHAVLSRPAVSKRLADLVVEHANLAQPDAESLGHLLEGADPTDLAALPQLLGDPSAFLSGAKSADLARVRAELDAVTAAVSGYVEHVTTAISDRIIGNQAHIGEAMRRKRVGRGEGEKVAEALFGLGLDQAQIDRGERFVSGVIERSGEVQLAKMWADSKWLPTPAEIDAPGLWLARIELPEDDAQA